MVGGPKTIVCAGNQKAPRKRAFATVVGPMLSKRAAIGWIYTGHTGEDLFLYAYGPNKPTGLIQNTDIAKITARSLGFDLAEVDRKLFVDAATAFTSLGAVISFDNSAFASVCHPRLTTLSHPKDEFGRVAAQKLLRMIGGSPEESAVLPWTLVERESVR